MLILEEHDLDGYIKEEVKEPKGDEAKSKHKKDMVEAKRIIVDYIKDHLIPQVYSKNTPKEVFDALTNIFERKNINMRMTLRNQLKGVKMQKAETMLLYFSRVSQIKEQLEAIGDMVEEVEVVMSTLNGLPREWDSFIRGICAKRKLTKFSKLWEECVQEEGSLENREEKLNEDEDQALAVHTKNGRNKRKDRGSPTSRGKKFKKEYSPYECYTCHKLGHISRHCPLNKNKFKKKNGKFHAHAAK